MSLQTSKTVLSQAEFIVMLALMTSLTALATDAMLPALPQIAEDLQVVNSNDSQLVVGSLFFGFAFGQLFYGPLSDTIGRKQPIYLGTAIFIVGCFMSMQSEDLTMMLAGRVLQGFGVAGPRIVSTALIRDQYEGRAMAKVMSLIMTVFILVPAIAPSIGQVILWFADWRAIFGMLAAMAVIVVSWFGLRQPETLTSDHRRPFSATAILSGMIETCKSRVALGYSIMAGFVFGALVSYLSSGQKIFQEIYLAGDKFALYFAILALSIGAASLLNAKLVMKLGMRRLVSYAVVVFTVTSIGFFGYLYIADVPSTLLQFMIYMMICFFCCGSLFGNLNALAMEPLGHMAGVGASVVGFVSGLLAMVLGTYVGQLFDGTILPMVGSFSLFGLASIGIISWINNGEQGKVGI